MGKVIDTIKIIAKKKWFWPVLIVVVILAIYGISQAAKPKTVYVTEVAKLGDIKQTVSATGVVTTSDKIDLNFKALGTISQILVAEGDYVTSGQVLAQLDAKNAQISVNQSQAALASAVANLNKLLAGASTQDLQVSKEAVDNAKTAYENAQRDYETLKTKLESDIVNLRVALSDAQRNLDNSKVTYTQNVVNAKSSALSTIDSNLLLGSIVLNNISYNALQIAGISVNQSRMAESVTQRLLALAEIDKARNYLNSARISNKSSDIYLALDSATLVLNETLASLSAFSDAVASASPGAVSDYSIIDAVKASVKTDQASMSAALSAVNTAEQTLINAENSYQTQVDTATAAVNSAQNNLNTALASKDVQLSQSKTSVDSMLGSYNLAKAQYDLKAANPRNVDIASYRAQVASAAAALDLAKQNLADYTLNAPTDGIITFVNYSVGEQPNSTKPVISMIGNNKFYIEVDIPESDIAKVSVSNPVTITLDAYSDSVIFNGSVVLIYPAETVVQDVVYYKVKVELMPSSYEIKSGMTANCTILTASKNNVLLIPYRAVTDQNGQNVVKVLVGNQVVTKNITIGLIGDEGEVEVISGLSAGEKVITLERTQ